MGAQVKNKNNSNSSRQWDLNCNHILDFFLFILFDSRQKLYNPTTHLVVELLLQSLKTWRTYVWSTRGYTVGPSSGARSVFTNRVLLHYIHMYSHFLPDDVKQKKPLVVNLANMELYMKKKNQKNASQWHTQHARVFVQSIIFMVFVTYVQLLVYRMWC